MRLARTIQRLWRVVRATPAQRAAIDAVLGEPVEVPPARAAAATGPGFDEAERVLSLAFDGITNAIEAHRERKRAGQSGSAEKGGGL